MKAKDYDYMFKVVLVGLTGVGKSNILQRYTKDQFSTEFQSTLGVEYATKLIVTSSGTRVKLQIWDTAGQEKYRSLMKTFYRGASAAIIVFDITREHSFENISKEIEHMKDFVGVEMISMIVGNKSDMEQQRAVSKERGLQLAQDKRVAYYETSAKTGQNVTLIFERLAEELEKAVIAQTTTYDTTTKKHNESVLLSHRNTVLKPKKRCCQ